MTLLEEGELPFKTLWSWFMYDILISFKNILETFFRIVKKQKMGNKDKFYLMNIWNKWEKEISRKDNNLKKKEKQSLKLSLQKKKMIDFKFAYLFFNF